MKTEICYKRFGYNVFGGRLVTLMHDLTEGTFLNVRVTEDQINEEIRIT